MKLSHTLAITGLALAISACGSSEPATAPVVTNSTEGYQQAVDTMNKGMMMSYTGNTDVDFAATMIPHHQGAIDMSEVQLKYGASPRLHSFSKSVIKTETAQIKTLQASLTSMGYPDAAKFPAVSSDNAEAQSFTTAMDTMHKGMSASYTSNADVDYATQMIPHHQGAIDMAKIEVKSGKDKSLKKLAASIIKTQTSEIKTLKSWLKWHADYVAGKAKKPMMKKAAATAASK